MSQSTHFPEHNRLSAWLLPLVILMVLPIPAGKGLPEAHAQSARDTAYEEGCALERKGNKFKAIDCFTQSLQRFPGRAQTLVRRANCYLIVEQNHKAILDCSEALRLDPNNADAYETLAQTYRNLGQLQSAESDMEKAVKLDPKNSSFYFEWAEILHAVNRDQEALQAYAKGGTYGQTGRAYREGGRLYWVLHRWSEAVSLFDKALKMEPDNANTRLLRARCYLHLNQFDKAVTDASFAASHLGDKRGSALQVRAEAYEKMGKTSLAKSDLAELKNIDDFVLP
jgi:tetratricopeptide (TPR) repeat protein